MISNLAPRLGAVAGAFLLLAALSGIAGANPLLAWRFRDAPPPGWGSSTPYWEPMTWEMVSGSGSDELLDPDNPFYVCTDETTTVLLNSAARLATDYVVGTTIWFANTDDSQNRVVVQLRSGFWGDDGSYVADDTLVVTNTEPPEPYYSDFGRIPAADVKGRPLVIKIIYLGAPADTRIYWDGISYGSHMWTGYWLATETSTWGKIKSLYRE
jgi:hypothetical protein